MDIKIPEASLIVLCGVAGCGKSTFAASNFKSTEIVSSDRCRAIISDDEENMKVSKDAFELFHFIIEKRMKFGKLVVADSTAISYEARNKLLSIAHDNNYYVILLVFDVALEKAIERNSMRNRQVPQKIIEKQYYALKKSLKGIDKEGFNEVIILEDGETDNVNFIIMPSEMFNNRIKSMKVSYTGKCDRYLTDWKTSMEEFIKPLSFKSRYGYEINLSQEEVQESVKLLSSSKEKLPWIVYVPPLIPSLSNGDLIAQIKDSLNYYADGGMRKCIIEGRKHHETCIVVITKDKNCSYRYFGEEEPGYIYSLKKDFQIEKQSMTQIVNALYNDLKKHDYFERNNTDFIILEALLSDDEQNCSIIPLKIIAFSRDSFLDKDNLWHLESIRRMSNLSEVIKNNEAFVLSTRNYKVSEIDCLIDNGKYNSFAIKPVKTYAKYKNHFLQPEVICSQENLFCGDDFLKLSMLSYDLCYQGMDMFIKNKFSKKYFEFLIGCATINNRMLSMRM